jgi:hypothetical protein
MFHLTTEQGNELLKAGGAIFVYWVKKRFDKWYNHNKKKRADYSFLHTNSIDDQINEICKNIGITYKFDRVTLTSYHNGTETYQGVSLSKLSITHEWPQGVATSIMAIFQSYPAGVFAKGIQLLAKSVKGYICIDEAGDRETNVVQNIFKVKKSYRFRVGKYITEGSLACSWLYAGEGGHPEENPPRDLTLEELDEIRYFSLQIGMLIKAKQKKSILRTVRAFFTKK